MMWQPTTTTRMAEVWNPKRLDWDLKPERLWRLTNDGPCDTWKYEWKADDDGLEQSSQEEEEYDERCNATGRTA